MLLLIPSFTDYYALASACQLPLPLPIIASGLACVEQPAKFDKTLQVAIMECDGFVGNTRLHQKLLYINTDAHCLYTCPFMNPGVKPFSPCERITQPQVSNSAYYSDASCSCLRIFRAHVSPTFATQPSGSFSTSKCR